MHARKVVPILLIVGGVMMIMKHKRHMWLGQVEEGEPRNPIGPHGGPHGEWGKRVPPLFEMWHNRAHAQAAQPPAI